jgi:acyl carrier protein
MESVELALMLEEALGIQIPPGALESGPTVGKVAEIVCDLLARMGRKHDQSKVSAIVREAVAEISGIAPEQVSDSTSFRELDWG